MFAFTTVCSCNPDKIKMKFSAVPVAIICMTLLSFVDSSAAADVEVKGTTLAVTQVAESDAFQYRPLANVKIKAFRGGPIFKVPKSSGTDGQFAFTVPEGVPFDVVFYLDQDTVPEMQGLRRRARNSPRISYQFVDS